jgi:thioredoxin-related protein
MAAWLAGQPAGSPAPAAILVEFDSASQKGVTPVVPRLSSIAALSIAFGCLLASAGASAADADRFFDQTLGDFRGELDAARAAGKQGVLLMFEAEGCPYCRRMRETVLNRRDVQTYFHGRFLIFSVDTRGAVPVSDFSGRDMTEQKFSETLRVSGTPTFLFVGLDGGELARYVGATRDAEMFMQIGRFVADGHYRRLDLDSFLKTDHTH